MGGGSSPSLVGKAWWSPHSTLRGRVAIPCTLRYIYFVFCRFLVYMLYIYIYIDRYQVGRMGPSHQSEGGGYPRLLSKVKSTTTSSKWEKAWPVPQRGHVEFWHRNLLSNKDTSLNKSKGRDGSLLLKEKGVTISRDGHFSLKAKRMAMATFSSKGRLEGAATSSSKWRKRQPPQNGRRYGNFLFEEERGLSFHIMASWNQCNNMILLESFAI